jgi:putative transposase
MQVSERDEAARAAEVGDVPGPPRVTGRQLRELLADDAWLDELIERAEEGGVRLTGEGGFLPELVRATLERGLAAEMTGHLGYEKGDRPGWGPARSSRGWCRRGSAASAAWTR